MIVKIVFLIARMLQFCQQGVEQTDLPKLLDNGKYSTFTQFLTKRFPKRMFL